jgi:L-threonylcarbamoyladenylate synthase
MSKNLLNEAIARLKSGEAIIIPTETVYGIAVDATNNSAIEKIYHYKRRERMVPLQVMVANLEAAQKFVKFNNLALKAAEEFLPGPLTMILDRVDGCKISEKINLIDSSVGIRIPDHKILLEFLNELEFPLAATSANISGKPPATSFSDAVFALENQIEFGIDGDKCELTIPSTVVDFRVENNPKIIRQGSLDLSEFFADNGITH